MKYMKPLPLGGGFFVSSLRDFHSVRNFFYHNAVLPGLE